ncbi:hypothetical protein DL766_004278 [Monosporascus sp. MC13-8B]|uniref:Uncharacterized protein n=1 Tax=Monosporascus cannonballus TaxID=155416 RepID=A0ABY0HEU5_9PEZI|nr:hypothetical protein DL762_003494 [Monosporascus cannonballus]RYO98580.1 hypothetical protein DL763_002110 [Monosporascus cannonballus]RYP31736.1 hypothetical protein DL766_004278 [Monosporascus sp. MC13-8B]
MGLTRVPMGHPYMYEVEQIHLALAHVGVNISDNRSWTTYNLTAGEQIACTYSVAPSYGAYITHYINASKIPNKPPFGAAAQIVLDNYEKAGGHLSALTYCGFTEVDHEDSVNAVFRAFRAVGKKREFQTGGSTVCRRGAGGYADFCRHNVLVETVKSINRRYGGVINSNGKVECLVGVTVPNIDEQGLFVKPHVYILAQIGR